MQIADGCGSGTLYKAGMGVPLNMGILPLFALGSFAGSAHLDRWLSLGQTAPVGLVDLWGAGRRWRPPGRCWRRGAGRARLGGLATPPGWTGAGCGARSRWRCWRP
jgi:hypothetical protein